MSLPRFEEPEANQSLEMFLGACLHGGGVWSGRREGDGLAYVLPARENVHQPRFISSLSQRYGRPIAELVPHHVYERWRARVVA